MRLESVDQRENGDIGNAGGRRREPSAQLKGKGNKKQHRKDMCTSNRLRGQEEKCTLSGVYEQQPQVYTWVNTRMVRAFRLPYNLFWKRAGKHSWNTHKPVDPECPKGIIRLQAMEEKI